MKSFLKNFLDSQSGATAIEYGIIAGLICVGIITGLSLFGNEVDNQFTFVGNEIEDQSQVYTG